MILPSLKQINSPSILFIRWQLLQLADKALLFEGLLESFTVFSSLPP